MPRARLAIPRLGMPLLLAVLPASLLGQTDSRLVAAVREAQEGQSDSARTAVQQLLAAIPASDTLYPQILYTAGIVANDAGEMRRKFQQVAIEFPTSAWADDALLRLAQLDYASHQLDAATRNLERIAVDFPESDLFSQAAYWAGRVYLELNKQADACRWLADGIARSREDVEIQTQLGYLYQRCGVATTARDSAPPANSDSAARPAPPSNSATPTPPAAIQPVSQPAAAKPARGRYRVQVAAVATSAAADAAARKVQAAGYQTVTVQEAGFYKVRAGDFPTRADAQHAATSIKGKLGGNPFVVSTE